MKKTEMTVTLERPARKQGGDRYENKDTGFMIYVPQGISRPAGKAVEKIKLTFETD